jgi:uncharacterized protein
LKLHADAPTALNTVTAYGPGFIEINRVRHQRSVVAMPDAPVESFAAASFDALLPEHFEALAGLRPDVVLLGTGSHQRFPHPRLTRTLAQARIGVEAMDTQAAGRTYNILMAEGRRVLAIFLLDS